MFTNILIPTDGSPLSEAAIQMGVRFAKSINARITGFHAIPEFHVFATGVEMVTDTKEKFAKDAEAHAKKYLAVIEKNAREAAVPCECASQTSVHPFEAIVSAAVRHKCDLIVMASHGRKGAQALLLGSETVKVLTHSKIPVLVIR
jgi:nucleotide-binding universal stress UspA family protein